MTIYQNTFDGRTTYHTSLKAAANDLVCETTGDIYSDHISTTRLDEAGKDVIVLDITDSASSYAQDIIDEDEQEGRYDRQHNNSLRQPSSISGPDYGKQIFELAADLMKGSVS